MWVYQVLHKTGLKGIFIFREMNLGQNNRLCIEKEQLKIISPTVLVFRKSLFGVYFCLLLKMLYFFICKEKLNELIYLKLE